VRVRSSSTSLGGETKGGIEDLRKIKHFCDFLIENEVKEAPLTNMSERRVPKF
jgi:hypothetical protein